MPFFAWLMFRLTSHWKQFRISGSSRIGNDLPVQAHPALETTSLSRLIPHWTILPVRHTRVRHADGRRRPALLPVLAAHAAHRPAGFPGPLDPDALEPSRASRAERHLPR